MADSDWATKDILVTVRAYPNPSRKYRETSCVAGIDVTTNSWIRLHPIRYRFLPDPKQFKKYDVIRLRAKRSSDSRIQSYQIDPDAPIDVIDHIDTGKNRSWSKRNDLILPLRSDCVEDLWEGNPLQQSLGLVRVRELLRVEFEEAPGGWSKKELDFLRRQGMFDRAVMELERPGHEISYKFLCDNPDCNSHTMKIVDWEVIQSYRSWKQKYGPDWEVKFRQKYEQEMKTRDLHLYLGTMKRYPKSWIVIGIYYPPRVDACASR